MKITIAAQDKLIYLCSRVNPPVSREFAETVCETARTYATRLGANSVTVEIITNAWADCREAEYQASKGGK